MAVIFFWSGLAHARNPKERAKDIGMGPGFTLCLGVAEMAGALGVARGDRPHPRDARRDPEEDLRLEDGPLGREGVAMNLVLVTIGVGRLAIG
ncbi:MAG: hypothetical protein WEF99_07390 [Thermoanaerobaculia bacterium]